MERRADAEMDASPRRPGAGRGVRPTDRGIGPVGIVGHPGSPVGERTRFRLSGPNVLMLQRLAGNAAVSAMLAPRQDTPRGGQREKPADSAAAPRTPNTPPVRDVQAPAAGGPRLTPPARAPAGTSAAASGPSPARPRLATPPPQVATAPSLLPTPAAAAHGQAKTAAAEAKASASMARLEAAVADVAKAADKVAGVDRPTETTAGGAQLIDAVSHGERRGRQQLAAASQAAAAHLAGGAAAEVERVRTAGVTARSAMDSAVTSTHARVAEVTSTHRGQVVESSAAATTRIGSWQQQAQTQLDGAFDLGVDQIGRAADQQATAVRASSDEASSAVVSQAGGAAEQAEPASGGGGGGGERGQGHAAVAAEVGGQAAGVFRAEGRRAAGALARQGDEAATEVARAGQAAATVLASGRGEAAAGVESATATAGQGAAKVGVHGAAALDRAARQASRQLSEVGAQAGTGVAVASAEHAARIGTAGAGAATSLARKVTEVATVATKGAEQQARKLARTEIDPADAAARADRLGTGLDGLYARAGQAAAAHGAQTRNDLAAAAAASSAALDQAATQVGGHLDQGALSHAASAGDVVNEVGATAARVADLTTTSGSAAVEKAAANVRSGSHSAADSLGQAGSTATTHLSGQAAVATGEVAQGVADAHHKVAEGQARFDDAYTRRQEGTTATQSMQVQRSVWSWLKGQWGDFLRMVTNPAFLTGLVVTLVLLPFLGPGAMVVGGAVGGMVGGALKNKAEGKPWYAWKNLLIGGLEGALVGAIFAGAAAALVYFNVGLLAGAAIMGGLSAGIGIIMNKIHGRPWDEGLLANFFLAAIFHLIGGAIKGMRGGKAPPVERPGSYGAVDPNVKPGNFEFVDTVNTKGAADVSVVTEVRQVGTGKTGTAQRVYFRAGRRLVMDNVDLSKIPSEQRWVKPAPDAEPVRLESYLTMRQMKIIEAELKDPTVFTGPRTVQMRNVVNIDAVFQLAKAGLPGTPARAAALRTCKSVTYAERSITASGGRIKSVSESGGHETRAGAANNPAKLAQYELQPDDLVQIGFTITIEVEPAPVPEPVAPGGPAQGTPVPVPVGGPPERDESD